MKKILIILLLFNLTSCDVFDVEPQTSLDANTVLVDGTSANSILLGAYSRMQNINYYGLEYILNNDLIADNAVFRGFFDSQLELDQKAVPFTNLWVTEAWPAIYRVVNVANLLITEIPNLEDPNFRNPDAVIAEAHAIRALAYFDLLRYYGEHFDLNSPFGLPLITEPIEGNNIINIPKLGRSTVAETYTLILNDLNTAIDLLDPGSADPGRMNYWAAVSLRARVNLYRKDYSAAFIDADMVITDGPFELLEDVGSIYETVDPTNESIFEVVFNDQDQSSYNTYLYRRNEYNVDPDLLAAFEEGDARGALFNSRNRTLKYADATNANNAKVLRLAELYFIRSESAVFANNDPNAGRDDLNEIRNRAELDNIVLFTSIDEYVDALLQERRVELNYEGHRFFDLVRFNKIGEVLDMPDFRKIMPIPRNELQVEDLLVQNPQYEGL